MEQSKSTKIRLHKFIYFHILQGHDESNSNSKPTKKVTIAEDHESVRKRHISGDVAYTDDEILSMARDDLVRLLGLDVSLLLHLCLVSCQFIST